MKEHYVYLLRCADGTLYAGYTPDLAQRVRIHNGEGKGGAKYTRSRRPVVLVYFEKHESKGEALRREYAIKHLTKAQKEALVAGFSGEVSEGAFAGMGEEQNEKEK